MGFGLNFTKHRLEVVCACLMVVDLPRKYEKRSNENRKRNKRKRRRVVENQRGEGGGAK